MSPQKIRRLKYACYTANISMAVVSNLSPVLFLTFRSLYGISYSLLGLLVLINFVTQLTVDLVFSFFSHKFNIPKAVRLAPYLTIGGILIYALWPFVFPSSAYVGLVIGTVLFSAASGFNEVLISPVIAAIPAKDPDREMSKLHSIYAWGVVFVVIVSTVFLLVAGSENWQYLALFFVIVPLASALLFAGAQIPRMETPEKASGVLEQLKSKTLWLCVIAIFLGGAAECTMAQWCSGYLEQALGIPKVWGDIFGVALFAVALGIGRTLYAKIGKNIGKVLFFGAVGAAACYLIAAISPFPVIGLLACAFTGFCVSMLWPGNLVAASDKIPRGGVFLFAMMAAGGDLGASVGPQLVGIVTDTVMTLPDMTEQIGMKAGMLVGMLFPLMAIPINLYMWKKADG
ncbi:MAG: MFS transporter [Clostridia bacterium]|nr:MFS transporter [Clostridia bacterium]